MATREQVEEVRRAYNAFINVYVDIWASPTSRRVYHQRLEHCTERVTGKAMDAAATDRWLAEQEKEDGRDQ